MSTFSGSSSRAFGQRSVIKVTADNLFVALNYGSNQAASSKDGISWTLRTMPTTSNWYGIGYGGNQYVAVADTSDIAATSPDGVNWTQRTMSSSRNWVNVAYGDGNWAAVDGAFPNGSTAASSTDGITWTDRTLPASGASTRFYYGLAYGAGVFATLVYANQFAVTSPTGVTWTQRNHPLATFTTTGLAFGNGVFCAPENGATRTLTSPTGVTWTSRTNAKPARTIAYGTAGFICVNSGTEASTSPDGISWTARVTSDGSAYDWGAFNGNTYVFVGAGHANALQTDDGITWNTRTLPVSGTWYRISGGKF